MKANKQSTGKRGRPHVEFRVFLKRKADGSGWRPCFYGRYMRDGKSKETSLCHWEGVPPETAGGKGDDAFEQSRQRAREIFEEGMEKDISSEDKKAREMKIYALRYGGRMERVKIADLSARWDALPHKVDLTAERRERVHSILRRFKKFMEGAFPRVSECGSLTAEHFQAFLKDVEESGVAARTWNDYMETLRSVLAKVDPQSRGFREYLATLPKRTGETVHRRPFDNAELESIFAAALETDPGLHPVLVAAACTALRRGDVCKLQWSAVDMDEGFITVKTSKTGETVEIPIFPPLLAVLKEADRKRDPDSDSPFVWPEIASAYELNPFSLNVRLSRVLSAAGFAAPAREGNGKYPAPASPGDAVEKVEAAIRRAGWSAVRRKKGLAILQKHLQGKNGKTIAKEIGAARGGVSTYLHEMETLAEIALVSPPKVEKGKATLAEIKEGEQRKNRGSLCGWHSFRTTFCTLALGHGVAMEILQKITGHRTAEIVLKHYDRRGRAAMRKAIKDAMPSAIVGALGDGSQKGRKPRKKVDAEYIAVPPELADKLSSASPEQWKKIQKLLNR